MTLRDTNYYKNKTITYKAFAALGSVVVKSSVVLLSTIVLSDSEVLRNLTECQVLNRYR